MKSSNFTEKSTLNDLLEKAIELNGYRNKLSHNPLRIFINKNSNGDLIAEAKLHDAKTGNEVAQILEQLPSKITESKKVFFALNKITSEFTIVNG